MAIFIFMIGRQLHYRPGPGEGGLELLRWSLTTLLFALFLLAYVRRRPAKGLASGPVETIFPLFCAALPFAVILGPFHLEQALRLAGLPASYAWWRPLCVPWLQAFAGLSPAGLRLSPRGVEMTGLFIMALGEALTVAGMLWLGRSFSIMSEARELVTGGLYRFVRHPLYAGEILSMWGFFAARPCWWTLLGCALFNALQALRARVEEQKLTRAHPVYAEYRKKTGFLFPRLF